MTVIASIRESDAGAVRRRLAALPPAADPVEIRGDDMAVDDWAESIAGCPRPVIATLRNPAHGGGFPGTESERRRRLLLALDLGASWIDVELDGALSDLAGGERARQVLLSKHGVPCTDRSLGQVLARMIESEAARFKIVAKARQPAELSALRSLLGRHRGRPLAAFAEGRAGTLSRMLATRWGSWATYGFPESGMATAEGQLSVEALRTIYDVEGIGADTRCVALVGSRIAHSPSPAMHAACMRESGLDMRYLPFEIDRFDECLPWMADGTFCGLAVTMPFKEEAAKRCVTLDRIASASGAVNTVVVDARGWHGSNTDGPAAARLLAERGELPGASVAIVGAGGTARAVAVALIEAGCRVTIFNRGEARRLSAAARLDCASRALEELPGSEARILVQTTPLGSAGEALPVGEPNGVERVLDVVYGSPTPLIRSARSRGLVAIDGAALLVEQALAQYRQLTGCPARRSTMEGVCAAWLSQQRSLPDC